jgi:prepilin peptidase CpaA
MSGAASSSIVPFAVTALFIGSCMASDLRTRRIPYLLTLPVIALGLALGTFMDGLAGFGTALGGAALATALLIGPFALGGIGGGDVKMMAAVGTLVGPQALLASLGTGVLLGGVFGAWALWRRGRLAERLLAIVTLCHSAVLTRSADPLRAPAADAGAVTLPYSVPLGLGTALALWLRAGGGA